MDKMRKLHKYNLKHYINYFNQNFKISLKERLEYKVNFFTSFFSHLAYLGIYLIFISIFVFAFGKDLNWTLSDYIVLYFFGNLIHHISGSFWYTKQMKWRRIFGDFNDIFRFPGNKLLNYICYRGYNPTIHLVLDIILVLPVLLFITNYTLSSIFISLSLTIFLIYFMTIGFYFLDSFSWYFLELGRNLSEYFYEEINDNLLYLYPGSFFTNFKIKFLLMFLPMYFVAVLIIPIFQNKTVSNLNFNLILLISLSFIFTLGTIINWKYGLKKYEAYG